MRLRVEVDVEMPDSPAAQRLYEPVRAALSEAAQQDPERVEIHAVRVVAVDLDKYARLHWGWR